MGVFGDTLRQARAHKGVTLRESEQATRISRHYLLALEEEHFDQLPAVIYQRGIVKNYATFLDLDPSKVLKLYQEVSGESDHVGPVVVGPGQYVEPAGGIVPNFAVIGFVVVMMAVVFAWGYSAYVASPDDLSVTQSPPTVTTVSQDDRFIPSATAAPPTATAVPDDEEDEKDADETGAADERSEDDEASRDAQIVLPSVTATSEPVEITFGGSDEEPDNGSEDEESAGASSEDDGEAGGDRQYSFYTTSDITLTVVVDNVVVWEGGLAADSETPYLSGDEFLVTFSGADALTVVDGEGVQREITGPTETLP